MNAEKQTQVKSPTMQLIDHCQKQNELIFATRKRLFKLEHNFRLTILAVAVVGSIIVLTLLGVVNG
jgi:cell division protein FtsL